METEKRHGVIVKKCACGSIWCPVCGPKKLQRKILERMSVMDYRYCREIMFSVDPKQYTKEEALDLLITYRRQLFDDLKRREGVVIKDWFGILEFYTKGEAKGYPHLHCIVMVDKKGSRGRIGGKALYRNWKYGIIKEWYFKNKSHWENTVGYAAKTGYFCKGDKAQYVKPRWLLKSDKYVRKIFGQTGKNEVIGMKLSIRISSGERKRRPYELILKECGVRSRVTVFRKGVIESEEIISGRYRDVIKYLGGRGRYDKGVGVICKLTDYQMFEFIELFDKERKLMPIQSLFLAEKFGKKVEGGTWL